MTPPTVPVTRWKPTRYGIVVAFMNANRAPATTASERLLAAECVSRLSDPYFAAKHDFEALVAVPFNDAKFSSECDRFEETVPADLLFPRDAWRWLAPILKAAAEAGSFARLRVRVDKSVEDAKDEEAPLAG